MGSGRARVLASRPCRARAGQTSPRACASATCPPPRRSLNLVENRAPERRDEIAALLAGVSPATLGGEAPAHVVGITGPPGAGKSSLLAQLVRAWRARGRTVAVLAVDPSSRRSGGSLLGDRARIAVDAADRGVFVRSMAAGGRLGGLAPATRAAAHALAAAFDVVVVETVGVGQSETEVAEAVDSVAVVVQPAAGDVLQFLKSGIMEIPDVLVVTKADLGAVALRSRRDLHAALRSLGAARHAGRRGLLASRPRRASTSSSTRSTSTARSSTSPRGGSRRGARARWPTSPSSTASAACARSAAGAPRCKLLDGDRPGARRPGADARARSSRPRREPRARCSTSRSCSGPSRCSARSRGSPGAPNLGTALSFGQIGFGLAAVYVLLRR